MGGDATGGGDGDGERRRGADCYRGGPSRGRSSAGRALDWQSRGSWVRVPSPPPHVSSSEGTKPDEGRKARRLMPSVAPLTGPCDLIHLSRESGTREWAGRTCTDEVRPSQPRADHPQARRSRSASAARAPDSLTQALLVPLRSFLSTRCVSASPRAALRPLRRNAPLARLALSVPEAAALTVTLSTAWNSSDRADSGLLGPIALSCALRILRFCQVTACLGAAEE